MRAIGLEAYVGLNSPLHRWTPRLKVVSLGLLMFAFAAVQHLWLLPIMLGITALLYGFSQLPFSFLRSRLCYPGLLILSVVLVLPFASGQTVLWQWGPLMLRQEGLAAMVLVVGRFVSILTLGFVLLGTTPFLTLVRVLRTLRLPLILVDMILLTYRYLYEIADTLATMQQSMRLRGFGHQRRRWLRLDLTALRQVATLLGTLLIRSYEQSERIYQAMRLRGYGRWRAAPIVAQEPIDPGSLVLTGLVVAIAILFVVIELGG